MVEKILPQEEFFVRRVSEKTLRLIPDKQRKWKNGMRYKNIHIIWHDQIKEAEQENADELR